MKKSNTINELQKQLLAARQEQVKTVESIQNKIIQLQKKIAAETHHTKLRGKVVESLWTSTGSYDRYKPWYYAFCLDNGNIMITEGFRDRAEITGDFIGIITKSSFSNYELRWRIETESGGKFSVYGYHSLDESHPINIFTKNKLDARRKWVLYNQLRG
jgi:hypothetical protein